MLADRFLAALELEMDLHAGFLRTQTVETVYVGGGTPTVLSPDQLSRLFSLIRRRVSIAPDAEITTEANPASATSEVLQALRSSGVTRISIGAQSFSDEVLAALGRAHSAEQARLAAVRARDAGIENVGLDLIYGVPRQSTEQWRRTVEDALGLAPDHLSVYCLSADTGSCLRDEVRSGAVTLPDEETAISMYGSAVDTIEGAGYHHYELSNFAKPGFECRHNRAYWQRGAYLGLGPGASSFVGNRRFENIADVAAYCARLLSGASVVESGEELTRDQAALEELLLGLRMTSGIDIDRFGERYGCEQRDRLLLRVREIEPLGLLSNERGRLRLTRRGMVLAQEVLSRIAA